MPPAGEGEASGEGDASGDGEAAGEGDASGEAPICPIPTAGDSAGASGDAAVAGGEEDVDAEVGHGLGGDGDRRTRVELLELVRAVHRERGMTTLMVTHAHRSAASLCDRAVLMKDGTGWAAGPTEAMLRPEVLDRLYYDVEEGGG